MSAPTLPPPWPGRLESFGDLRLFVRHTPGTGDDVEPAVAVHGLGGAATNWTDLAGLLSDRVQTWALDLPGFGHSPPPDDGDLSIAGHVRAATALVEHVVAEHGPVHLFGNSLGGVVATEVAGARPDLVRTLTLVSPALPHYRLRASNLHLPLLAAPLLGNVLSRRLAGLDVERRVRATIALCYADPDRVPAQRVEEALAEARRRDALPYAPDVMLSSLRGLLSTYVDPRASRRAWALAAAVTAPTLLVYGLKDRLVDPRTAARAARTFHRSWLLELPDAGHVAQMEHPAVVARAVRELLDATGPASREPGTGVGNRAVRATVDGNV